MADNSPKAKLNGITKAFSDPKARKGIILFGAVGAAVLVGASMMSGGSTQKNQVNATATVAPPPPGQRDVTAQTNEKYKDLVKAQDQERSDSAKTNPTSVVLPTIAGLESSEERKKQEAVERGRQAALTQNEVGQRQEMKTSAQAAGVTNGQQGPSPTELARNTLEYKVTQTFLNKIALNYDPGRLEQGTPLQALLAQGYDMAGAAEKDKAKAQASKAGQQTVGNGNGTGMTQTAGNQGGLQNSATLVRAGEIIFATTDVAVNTDYSGPVTATIRQGKFAGYRLLGQKRLEQEAVVLRFTKMSPVDGGRSLDIDAYAVSLGNQDVHGLTGLEGKVDRHLIERWVLPAAAAFVQTFGMASSVKGSTAVVGEGGSVGTSTDGYTAADRRNIAMGAAMNPIANDLQRNANRPVTVSLPAQVEIGIMFAADVNPNSANTDQAARSGSARSALTNEYPNQPAGMPGTTPTMQQMTPSFQAVQPGAGYQNFGYQNAGPRQMGMNQNVPGMGYVGTPGFVR